MVVLVKKLPYKDIYIQIRDVHCWLCLLGCYAGFLPTRCPSSLILVRFLFSSVAQSCPTLCDPMKCSTPGLPVHQTSRVHPKPCPLRWWCNPTILSSVVPFSSCPQSFPSIRVFSSESALRIRWPKYWSFSFNISPSNEHPGLTSFRMDWLDLPAIQGTLKSLLQHHSSKASILRHSAFFIVQLSHPYMTTGKTIALTMTGLCWQSNVSAF